jgi:hypothetical protein
MRGLAKRRADAMELSPEKRKRIYEEEKPRLESQELEKNGKGFHSNDSGCA